MAVPAIPVTEIEKQIVFIDRMNSHPMPCPACGERASVYDVTKTNRDTYDFNGCGGNHGQCPGCHTVLRYSTPAFGPACWVLDRAREAYSKNKVVGTLVDVTA